MRFPCLWGPSSLLPQDPVILPDSRITVDRPTIERHLLSSATDPFSRAPLEAGQLIPNDALRAQVQAWLEERGGAGGGGAMSPR